MQDVTHILSDLTAIDGQPMTASRKVAARFKKAHKNVLQSIKRIEVQQPEFSRLNFQPVEYTDSSKNFSCRLGPEPCKPRKP